MLTINTRNDKLAAARVDFLMRGMLQGTCLGAALQSHHRDLNGDTSDDNGGEDNKRDGPDGNGEAGCNLDVDHDDNEDDGAPGPVDGPSILSEVVLAQKRGIPLSIGCTRSTKHASF